MVDGYYYLELVEPIKELKRQGSLEEALVVCYKAIERAEGDRGGQAPQACAQNESHSSPGLDS